MISTQPAIPMLTHVENLGDIKTDLAGQQASLLNIANNTGETNTRLDDIENGVLRNIDDTNSGIESNTSSIKTSSSNTATATSSIYSSVGTAEDASTENTVIGLLKSIANKLSSS